MTREKGSIPFSANFEAQKSAPIDARMICDTKADLLLATTWEANDGGHYAYVGMLVAVNGDSTPANNGVYRLTALPYTSAGNWEQLGSASPIPSGMIYRKLQSNQTIPAGGCWVIMGPFEPNGYLLAIEGDSAMIGVL